MTLHNVVTDSEHTVWMDTRFTGAGETSEVPTHTIPLGAMEPRTAYQLIHDELMLNGNARQNMATFVTTWMDEYADRLFAESAAVNSIDKDEYPMSAEIERRCVNMVANLWHAAPDTIGASAIGSSEAVMLAGLAMKLNWRKKRKAAGEASDCPNLVMSSTVQVVWEKFCRYWDVEPRYVPVERDRLELTGAEAVKYVDENTIGVVGILGVTYHGAYEPIRDICEALDKHQAETGLDIPVHVDAASGGFVAPFAQPELEWDFRLPRVISINASGHKYGLVYPGIGWVVWRDKSYLPEELVFEVNYLGGNEPTFTLNFSRPGAQIVGQYYMFLRLGFEGYRKTHEATLQTAQHISAAVEDMGPYKLISRGDTIPVFAFMLKQEQPNFTLYDVSKILTMHGWQVPAYTFPSNVEDLVVMRVCVRNGFGRDLADLLIRDIKKVTDFCSALQSPLPDRAGDSFSHGGRAMVGEGR
jgi:glutamate decarboxylase